MSHEIAEEGDAIHARHFDIKGENMGLEGSDFFARFERIGRSADDENGGIARELAGEKLADHSGIVDDENADGGGKLWGDVDHGVRVTPMVMGNPSAARAAFTDVGSEAAAAVAVAMPSWGILSAGQSCRRRRPAVMLESSRRASDAFSMASGASGSVARMLAATRAPKATGARRSSVPWRGPVKGSAISSVSASAGGDSKRGSTTINAIVFKAPASASRSCSGSGGSMHFLQNGGECCAELFGGKGLLQVSAGALSEQLIDALGARFGADDDDRDGLQPRISLYGGDELCAAEFGHVKISEDEINLLRGEERERLAPVAGFEE